MSVDTQSIPQQWSTARPHRDTSVGTPLLLVALLALGMRVLLDEVTAVLGLADIYIPPVSDFAYGDLAAIVKVLLQVVGLVLLSRALVAAADRGAELRVVAVARKLALVALVGAGVSIAVTFATYSFLPALWPVAGLIGGFFASNAFFTGELGGMFGGLLGAMVFGVTTGLVMAGTARRARRLGIERGSISAPVGYSSGSTAPAVDLNGVTRGGTNGIALAAFIVMFFSSIVGMILGYIALSQIRQTGQGGRRMALAAIWVGWASVALTLTWLVVLLVLMLNH